MSIKMLAFNTSTKMCSVALLVDDIIVERCKLISVQHEKNILSIIDCLLVESNLTLQSLDCLVFCRGPGSFVGVRIGVSVAQGLSLGTNLPLIEVSSLEVLAQGIWRSIGATQVLSIIGAGLGKLYCGCYYRQNDGSWLGKENDSLITPVDVLTLISKLSGKWVLVGQDWDRCLCFRSEMSQISIKKMLFPLAQDMLSIAIKSWNRGEVLAVHQVQPIYFNIKI